MRVSVLTLGCKTNLSESDWFKIVAKRGGHEVVDLHESPDLCIINTCTVTSKSDYQCRQLIRRALRTGAEVVVTGCYAEIAEPVIKAISSDIKIVKNPDKNKILHILDGHNESKSLEFGRARPFVKIQDGCSFSCSYCIIPRARGRPKSRPIKEVLEEVQAIEEAGYREVVLTGIHIGLYGVDIPDKVTLSELIKNLLNKTDNIRIRLSSLEINEVTEEMLELLQDPRICPHLHLPLQSGDDDILKAMRRPYTTAEYLRGVEIVLNRVDNLALGTDIIVGFPGEGDKEFKNTKKFIENIPFSYMHIFPYSERPGTLASKMDNKVSPGVKKERARLLREIDQQKRTAYRKAQIGRILEVINERKLEDGLRVGKSENYVNVYFKNPYRREPRLLKVKVLNPFRDGVYGIMV
jgi:threonylcarbamoyladenosine tRNA methylthiotransferase MtaB